jgi:hypothetical protein
MAGRRVGRLRVAGPGQRVRAGGPPQQRSPHPSVPVATIHAE